jgi:hypothetical protein
MEFGMEWVSIGARGGMLVAWSWGWSGTRSGAGVGLEWGCWCGTKSEGWSSWARSGTRVHCWSGGKEFARLGVGPPGVGGGGVGVAGVGLGVGAGVEPPLGRRSWT